MNGLYQRWQAFSPRNRNVALVLAVALLIGLYVMLAWPHSGGRLKEMEYQQQKQRARQKAGNGKQVNAQTLPDLGGQSPEQARKELGTLRSRIEELKARQVALRARLLNLDNTEGMLNLKSQLITLAESGDMEVQSLEHVFIRDGDQNRPPTPERLAEAAGRNPYKRPLIRLKARASYRGLMQFLSGLGNLEHIAAPVKADIRVRSAPSGTPTTAPQQWLDVELQFAI